MEWGNLCLWNIQERKTALSSKFIMGKPGCLNPRKTAAYFKHCVTPEDMTEADLAVLLFEPDTARAVLSANCAGETCYRDPTVFNPRLTGMRITDVTGPAAVAANAAVQPNAGWRIDAPPTLPARLLHSALRAWQALVVQLFLHPATESQRHLWWFHGVLGNIGKSWLCAYLRQNCRALIMPAAGEVKDQVCILANYIQQHGHPAIILFDIGRGGANNINAAFVESLLNGHTCTMKYNSAELVLGKVHIAVFSNSEPVRDDFSLDRWSFRGASTVINLEASTVFDVDDHDPVDETNDTDAAETLAALPRAPPLPGCNTRARAGIGAHAQRHGLAANAAAPPVTHVVSALVHSLVDPEPAAPHAAPADGFYVPPDGDTDA